MNGINRESSFADLNNLTDPVENIDQVERRQKPRNIINLLDRLINDYKPADFGSPQMVLKLDQIKVILEKEQQNDKSLPLNIELRREDELYLTNIVAGEDYQSQSSQEIANLILEFYKSKQ